MSLSVSHNTKIYLQLGSTDMRNGVNGLSSLIIDAIAKDANASSLFVFRGRRADKIKILYWDGQGFCLFYKRLERGKFVWPKSENGGPIMITTAQLSMLLEGIDWRSLQWSAPPEMAG